MKCVKFLNKIYKEKFKKIINIIHVFLLLFIGKIKILYFDNHTGDKLNFTVNWFNREILFDRAGVISIHHNNIGYVLKDLEYVEVRNKILKDWNIYVEDYSTLNSHHTRYLNIHIHSNCRIRLGSNCKLIVNGSHNNIELRNGCDVEILGDNNFIYEGFIESSNIKIEGEFCIFLRTFPFPLNETEKIKSRKSYSDINKIILGINTRSIEELSEIFKLEEILYMKNNLTLEEVDKIKMLIELGK